MARKCCTPSAPLALLSHNLRFCNASMTAFCSHPARHVSSTFPFLSVIESDGLWSSWAGHTHRHSLPMRRPLSAVAILAAVIVHRPTRTGAARGVEYSGSSEVQTLRRPALSRASGSPCAIMLFRRRGRRRGIACPLLRSEPIVDCGLDPANPMVADRDRFREFASLAFTA